MGQKENTDWFARVIAILGLLIAMAAVIIPYYQSKNDEQEVLSIKTIPEGTGGVIKLSADPNKSRAVQVPWIFTLSNTGKVKLSITSYEIQQIEGQTVMMFSGLDGGLTSSENKFFKLPQSIDAGESITFRAHIGFIPSIAVQKHLSKEYEANGALDAHETFISLAKAGMTLYGGRAEYKEYKNGGRIISIDPASYENDPMYKVNFITGRGNVFSIITSESYAKWQLTR